MKIVTFIFTFLVLTTAPASADTYVIGDSLTDQTYRSDGWVVDAVVGAPLRTSNWRVDRAVRNNPQALVIALGSNDVAQRSGSMESDISRATSKAVPCTVITTVKVRGVTPFYNTRWVMYAQRWNTAARSSGAIVANWNVLSRGHANWFLADGLHLTAAGESAYDQMLRQAVANCP